MDNTLIIKKKELDKAIEDSFSNVKHAIVTDKDYALLDLEWVKKVAYPGFLEWIQLYLIMLL